MLPTRQIASGSLLGITVSVPAGNYRFWNLDFGCQHVDQQLWLLYTYVAFRWSGAHLAIWTFLIPLPLPKVGRTQASDAQLALCDKSVKSSGVTLVHLVLELHHDDVSTFLKAE